MVDDGTCDQGGCLTDSRFDAFDPSATFEDGQAYNTAEYGLIADWDVSPFADTTDVGVFFLFACMLSYVRAPGHRHVLIKLVVVRALPIGVSAIQRRHFVLVAVFSPVLLILGVYGLYLVLALVVLEKSSCTLERLFFTTLRIGKRIKSGHCWAVCPRRARVPA